MHVDPLVQLKLNHIGLLIIELRHSDNPIGIPCLSCWAAAKIGLTQAPQMTKTRRGRYCKWALVTTTVASINCWLVQMYRMCLTCKTIESKVCTKCTYSAAAFAISSLIFPSNLPLEVCGLT